jgi:tetratricopeptide (TPR) repeat protein
MKKAGNLRAANQLERIGKFSAAIDCLEEFLLANPDYEERDAIHKKIIELTDKLYKEGDAVVSLNLRALIEIPERAFKWLLGSLFDEATDFILSLLLLVIVCIVLFYVFT